MAENGLVRCLQQCQALSAFNLLCLDECYSSAGWTKPEDGLDIWHYFYYLLLSGCLVMCSALFSGLTLGLMSLDIVELQIVMESGTPEDRELAKKIAPMRKKGNLLLCTLVLGNTSVNTLLSITLAQVAGGILGFFLSTGFILIFGEILPQAICSRHALAIGAKTAPVMQIFIILFFPIAYPISLVLDKLLGRELGLVFNRDELKKLIEIHVSNPAAALESGLTKDDGNLLTGVFEYKKKKVRDVFTPLDRVYMLELMRRLDYDTLAEIYKSGFTRIPVYDEQREHIVGILYVKDLILVDPEDEVEVRTILSFHARDLREISEDAPLDVAFKEFKSTCIHLLFVIAETRGNMTSALRAEEETSAVLGIITLEDVLEEMIQDDIIDETDQFVNVNDVNLRKVKREVSKPDAVAYMNLFDQKRRQKGRGCLSAPEVQAIVAFLSLNVDEFKALPAETALKGLVRRAALTERQDNVEGTGESVETHLVYKRGCPTSFFTLIIQGKLLIRAGKEEFESEQGPWNCLGSQSLVDDNYVPDFTALTCGPCRLLQIHRKDYIAAVHRANADFNPLSRPFLQVPPGLPLHMPRNATGEGRTPPPAAPKPSPPQVTPSSSRKRSSQTRATEARDRFGNDEATSPTTERTPLISQSADADWDSDSTALLPHQQTPWQTCEETDQSQTMPSKLGAVHPLVTVATDEDTLGTLAPSDISPRGRMARLGSASWRTMEAQSEEGQGFMVWFDNSWQRDETTVTIYMPESDDSQNFASPPEVFRELGLVVRNTRIYTEGDRVQYVLGVVTEAGEQIVESEWESVSEGLRRKLLDPS